MTANSSARAAMASLGLLAATAAHATPQTQSFGITAASSTASLTFADFNPSLGTLTGVSFALSNSTPVETAHFVITGGEGGSGSGRASAIFVISGPGGKNDLIFGTGSATASAACSGPQDCSATNTTVTAPMFTSPVVTTNPSKLALYQGAGTFDLTARFINAGIATTSCSTAGTCTTTGALTWNGDVTVSFQYDPVATTSVPEPVSGGLLAGGIGLVALFRSRRRFPQD